MTMFADLVVTQLQASAYRLMQETAAEVVALIGSGASVEEVRIAAMRAELARLDFHAVARGLPGDSLQTAEAMARNVRSTNTRPEGSE